MAEWKEYDFYTDEKKTIWYRVNFSIRAQSEEEAMHLAKQMFDRDDYGGSDYEWEQLTDTVESMSVEENGTATRELYDQLNGNIIKDNLNTEK
jgi:1,2-phenylacetyl-CoA epoxidase PaaB subunit